MKLKRWSALVAVTVLLPLAAAGLSVQPAAAAGFPTTTTIGSTANPAAACSSVTFTATVHGALFPDSPEGLVQFFDGASLLGGPQLITPDFDPDPIFGTHTIPTNHSSASLSVSLSGGTHDITAAYAGSDVPSLGGPFVQEVGAASSSTALSSSVNPTVYGQQTVLEAAVSSPCSAPVAGTVQFQVDGAPLGGPQAVGPTGHAAFAAADLAVGTHPVAAVFTSSSTDVLGSSGSIPGGQVVNSAATSTSLGSSANPSEFGANVTFTSTTSPAPPGAGTVTGQVQFADGGVALGGPRGLSSGGQSTMTTAALPVGSHAITASYASDGPNFTNSTGSLTQVVNEARTTLTYTGGTSADYNDPAVLSARLTRTDNSAPIAGKLVSFAMGAEHCTQVTDINGLASCTITPSEVAATYPVTAAFADDGNYLASGTSGSFLVTREETTTVYTGPTVIAQGHPVTLSGQLLEDGTTPISGRLLTLTLGSGAAAQSCTTTATDASGNASCVIAGVSVDQGPQPVSAAFSGDAYYVPSSDTTHQAIVFAFPGRGIFTLGNVTVAAGPPTVTFWGAQWAANNDLSGGASPSFKGFADNPGSTPPACGASWASSPGNSSSPVSSVPAYMGTAVTSSVTKHGSSIGGTITAIVVVVTAPGYQANPGHAGTGTVVATYCHS